jgi:hypothetical protein
MDDDDIVPVPRRKAGRPPRIVVPHASVAGVTCEEHLDRIVEAVGGNIEALRQKSRVTQLTDREVLQAGKLARTLETCAQAKRHLIEAAKGGEDLSGIPTEQLARVVVRAMRTDADLKAAIVAEIKTKAD